MAKKNGKKSKKKAKKQRATEEGGIWPLIIGLLLLVVIIGAVLLLTGKQEYPVECSLKEATDAFRALNVSEIIIPDLAQDFSSGNFTLDELDERYPGYEEDIRSVNDALQTSSGDVVAIVNGQTILRSELELQSSLLPEQYRELMTEEQILDQMVNEEVLMQDAVAQGIEPSQEELDAAYEEIKDAGNLTDEGLAENLATYNLGIEDLQRMLKKQLTINKLFEEMVDSKIEVSEEEIETFYEENKEAFGTPEEVTVKHILIALSDDRDAEAAHADAEAALARYENGEDFCDLVAELSDDPGSVGNCGQYTFGRGLMVPEFEDAAFEMENDETRVVDSMFGSHVMLKVDHSEGEPAALEDVRDAIEQQLASQKSVEGYQAYISALRENADVQILLGSATPEEETPAENDAVITLEDDENTTMSTSVNIVETTENETEEPVDEQEGTPVEEEPVLEEVTVVTDEPEQEPSDSASFATCLTENGVVLYTISWAPASLAEQEKFGDDAAALTVMECSDGCEGVDMFPTWKISGELHVGKLSFEELADLSGCSLE